ncbi:MAG: hypothetical protein MJ147_08325 [Clostridia bacterium]|nr:hypothetical protein [Clostridia bacterium]
MKSFKKIISVILCISLVVSLSGIAFSANAQDPFSSIPKATKDSYPYVLVHGMMGWGENDEGSHNSVYWGMNCNTDIATMLRDKGYTVAVPTVSPMGSAWDRACELFAQLTGTVVDYGKAHSEAHHHSRFGRDYTGRALLNKTGWDVKTPINLVTHSFGGPTGYVFTSLLEYGSQDEITASPNDCSELFKGGHKGLVYSMTTLESPHNGSPASNVATDTVLPVCIFALVINFSGIKGNSATDYMFDQFGLTKDPATGEKAKLNLAACLNLVASKDHAGYDMTLKGAREIYEKHPMPQGTYLFSISADSTKALGNTSIVFPHITNIKNPLAFTSVFVWALSVIPVDEGKIPGTQWAPNDGLVPVVSALHPFNQPFADYTPQTLPKTGVWYSLPVIKEANHGYGISGGDEKIGTIWGDLLSRVESIKAK